MKKIHINILTSIAGLITGGMIGYYFDFIITGFVAGLIISIVVEQ